ncbi:GvpL/GvpF family gas vesicle protein [Streptomyces violaceorubidus]
MTEARRADFTAALARFTAGGHPAVRVVASGPWIPYSFARWDEDPRADPQEEVPS